MTPEDRGAPRAEPFEISQEAGDRQGEEEQQPQEATDEELEQARLQADQTAIEGIRRAEVCCFLFPEINCHGNVLFFSSLLVRMPVFCLYRKVLGQEVRWAVVNDVS